MHIRKVEPRAVPLASLANRTVDLRSPSARHAQGERKLEIEDDRTPLARAEFQDEASDAFGEWLWLLDRGLVGAPRQARDERNGAGGQG